MKHAVIALPAIEAAPARYGADRGVRPGALAMVVAGHIAILAALSTWQIVGSSPVREAPLIVSNVDLSQPPPPPAKEVPQPQARAAAPQTMVAPALSLPRESAITLAVAPIPSSPPPAPGPVQADAPPAHTPAPPAEPARTVAAGDMSSSMIHAPPPKYPRESRRRREQGVVLLAVLLSAEGRVAEIRIARSSGHSRLDTAARDAVRGWRWSPTLRDGVAVQVSGTVEIPFVLTG